MCGNCCSANASIEFVLGLAIFCLFCPFWVLSDFGVGSSSGLVLTCSSPYSGIRCSFIDYSRSQEWFVACGVFWMIGTILLTVCGLTYCCVSSCGRGCARAISIACGIAAVCFIISILIYAIEMGNIFSLSFGLHYSWTFYISWITPILALGVSSVYGKVAHNMNNTIQVVPANEMVITTVYH